jgi:ribosomal protein L11 methyltransferase
LASHPALVLRYAPGAGVDVLHDLLYAELDPFEPLAIQEEDTADGWRVFFRTATQRDDARAAVASALGSRLIELSAIDVEDDGWARRSQAGLKPVQAGRFIITPPWDVPTDRDADTITIVIDPSMGFGTGHHATTRMCLELLQQIDLHGTRVIDVGTGSGILALAAWKLGAFSVLAIDRDPDALQNARDNIARNGGTGVIDVVEADLAAEPGDPADVVVANLTGAALEQHANTLRRMTADRGAIVVSGFSLEELDGVAGAFGLVPRRVVREGEWAAAMF